ncbi:MAG: corrinoid protein [Candidatus Eiseniibacteriota bacterium]|nr:MAG: corrinoid protein [Candidatus Eisenbacteria bacterium]
MDYFLAKCSEAVSKYDTELAASLAEEALTKGVDPMRAIEEGFAKGLEKAGTLWEEGTYFLPELMMASEAMKTAMAILKPALEERSLKMKRLGKVVIGTVEGDIHDIGKSLVASMLSAGGFDVVDLGADVSVENFVKAATREEADLVCMSALLTTTMPAQQRIIQAVKKAKPRKLPRTMIGGAPTSDSWAAEIGADAYAPDAVNALNVAKRLMSS